MLYKIIINLARMENTREETLSISLRLYKTDKTLHIILGKESECENSTVKPEG